MAKSHNRIHSILLDYRFDRLSSEKLSNVYDLLVPWEKVKNQEHTIRMKGSNNESGSNVHKSFIRTSKGSTNN